MSNLFKVMFLSSALFLSACSVDDVTDADKYTKPTVNAGADQLHTLPVHTITLSGSAKTYPKHVYEIKTIRWTQLSGPQQLTVLNSDSLNATLINPTVAGTYIFELYVKDSARRTNTDRVTVILHEQAQMTSARMSAGFHDDYDEIWHSVAENYTAYDQIEDKWHEIYQPYKIKADNIDTAKEWQKLVQEMLLEVKDARLVINPFVHSQSLASSQALARDQPLAHPQQVKQTPKGFETSYLRWETNNNIGLITFNDLSSVNLKQLNKEINQALIGLKDTHELWLDFPEKVQINEQVALQLMMLFTHKATHLYLDAQADDISELLINSNPLLPQSIVRMKKVHSHQAVEVIEEYLLTQELGVTEFIFKQKYVVTAIYL
ncbi:MAG: PKD domain-containing protein [Vibrio gallaecicus]